MNGGLRAEAEPALGLLGLHPQRDQQPVAGRRDVGGQHRDLAGALPVSGKVLPLSCASITRLNSVNGTSIGTAILTSPWSMLRHQIEPRRERAVGLGLGRHDARLGLHAEREDHPVRHRCAAARRTRGSAASRATATGSAGRRLRRAGSSGTASPIACAPQAPACGRCAAAPEIADLLVHGPVEQRLHLVADVELDAGDAEPRRRPAHAAGEVRLDPPVRQQRRPRSDRDVAADVGALVERACR